VAQRLLRAYLRTKRRDRALLAVGATLGYRQGSVEMDMLPKPLKYCSPESQEIEERARALLENHAHFRGRARRFEFRYSEEVLTVRGSVPTFYLKQVLQSALINLEGVRVIENNVNVLSGELRRDGAAD
jgi:hypothetical protein